MSRRIAFLALVGAAGALAGSALAGGPPGGGGQPADSGLEPSSPTPASLCADYPHPVAACSAVAVSCPSSPRAQIACKTVGTSGSESASVRKLELQLPRRYVTVKLTCRADAKAQVACRIASRTVTAATGVHVSVVRLPHTFRTVHIACATTNTRFACRLAT